MSDRLWVQDVRQRQTVMSLPFGLGWTIDITQTLTALAAAGMPARVEAFDLLRFEDGRTGFLSTPDPTTTISEGGPDSRDADLIVLPGGSEGGVVSLARRYSDLVVVNGKRQRVWADGRQVSGSSMQRDATPGWRNVFAIARTITVDGGTTADIATRTGLPGEHVRAALLTLGEHVLHTPLGWEATARGALIDWVVAAYPGPGGIRTCWKRDATLDEQADELIVLGGVMSDRWAAHQSWAEVLPNRLTAFFAVHPDMAALGYEPAGVDEATVKVLVPQDTTIFAPPNLGRCTDDFITASVIWQDGYTDAHTDAVNGLRQLLHFRADTAYDLRWMHVQ
ncbi:hypothetical protein KK090_02370 [Curtobacterium flaccumfaciens pv. poinsettiae]|uniref:hypothetical protein n=1 Tax=Curtobacterium poinsettiae TaxID=159612 RepID=UPI001BDFCBD8|nr:hypothetical protein [Curtobacterium flaccumfaciens]MBT1618093.1 hypothetical protein [Curtobacterium flaccumfaciens pv. poinsettiae]